MTKETDIGCMPTTRTLQQLLFLRVVVGHQGVSLGDLFGSPVLFVVPPLWMVPPSDLCQRNLALQTSCARPPRHHPGLLPAVFVGVSPPSAPADGLS